MFSGIVQMVGSVRDVRNFSTGERRMQIDIEAPRALIRRIRQGSSIAVQGMCLTATRVSSRKRFFTADIITPTYARTTVRNWLAGKRVNLEPSLSAGDEIGGHIVQGHITGTAIVQEVGQNSDTDTRSIVLSVDDEQEQAIIDQGSIAIDGVSLTIAQHSRKHFTVGIIPYTWQNTTLGSLADGDAVNIETDMFLRMAMKSMRAAASQKQQVQQVRQ